MCNKAILIWNITKDPEMRQTESGSLVVSCSMATNEFYKDKNGEKQQQTDFHNLTAFWKTAELFEKFVKKGQKIFIEGKIKTRSREAQDGTKRYSTFVLVDKVEFLGGKKEEGSEGNREGDEWYEDEKKKQESSKKKQPKKEEEISIEDIPF